jgi:hypothetical protein
MRYAEPNQVFEPRLCTKTADGTAGPPDEDQIVLMTGGRIRRADCLAVRILIVNEWLPQKAAGIKGPSRPSPDNG